MSTSSEKEGKKKESKVCELILYRKILFVPRKKFTSLSRPDRVKIQCTTHSREINGTALLNMNHIQHGLRVLFSQDIHIDCSREKNTTKEINARCSNND